jgi:PST family polysaccharide transporter
MAPSTDLPAHPRTSSSALRVPHSALPASPDPFATDHLEKNLKRNAVRGGAATATTQGLLFLFKCASVPILARLLTPADFGLVAMVTAITGFVHLFEDAGLSMATVQRAKITHEQVSTLFWLNVALGVVLMLITACLAPGIAWFYGEPRLVAITLVLAGIMLLGSLNVQHRALLERNMRFATLGVIRIASRVARFVTGVSIAILGGGYWALVSMSGKSGTTVDNVCLRIRSTLRSSSWSLSRNTLMPKRKLDAEYLGPKMPFTRVTNDRRC